MLLCLTHQQWLHCNTRVHFRRLDGCTLKEHKDIVAKIKKLVCTNPEELLANNRHLVGVDFSVLGRVSVNEQAYWVAEVETALFAVKHSRARPDGREDANPVNTDGRPKRCTPSVDSEGSMKYKRQRDASLRCSSQGA